MSYGFMNLCWACKKLNKCHDSKKIEQAIDKIHQDTETHKGCGNMVLLCFKQETTLE